MVFFPRAVIAVLDLTSYDALWAAQYNELSSLWWPNAPEDELSLATYSPGGDWCALCSTSKPVQRCGRRCDTICACLRRPLMPSHGQANFSLHVHRSFPCAHLSKLVDPRRSEALGAIILGLRKAARTAPECRKLPEGCELRMYYA